MLFSWEGKIPEGTETEVRKFCFVLFCIGFSQTRVSLCNIPGFPDDSGHRAWQQASLCAEAIYLSGPPATVLFEHFPSSNQGCGFMKTKTSLLLVD